MPHTVILKKLLPLLLCLWLGGCRATLYTWKDLPPEPKNVKAAQTAQIRKHFTISEIRGSGFLNFETEPRFTTETAAGRYYSLHSYTAVVQSIAPETEPLFMEAKGFSRSQLAVDTALLLTVLGALSVPTLADEAISPATGAWIFGGMVVALLGLGVLEYSLELQEYERYERIRTLFNAALKNQYSQ